MSSKESSSFFIWVTVTCEDYHWVPTNFMIPLIIYLIRSDLVPEILEEQDSNTWSGQQELPSCLSSRRSNFFRTNRPRILQPPIPKSCFYIEAVSFYSSLFISFITFIPFILHSFLFESIPISYFYIRTYLHTTLPKYVRPHFLHFRKKLVSYLPIS